LAGRLYEHLIKPLSIGRKNIDDLIKGPYSFNSGPGDSNQKVWLNGRDHLEGMNLSFTWGFYSGLGQWHGPNGLHVHPYPECQLFVGLNPANINYLGAEIECRLGEECEPYTFKEPTVVVVPAGLPHGPILTKDIFSPKGFASYMVALSVVPATTWLETKATNENSKEKYSHLVKSLRPFQLTEQGKIKPSRFKPEQLAERIGENKSSKMTLGPGNADFLTWLFGSDLGGLDVNMDWGFFSKPGLWHRGVGAHLHSVDEVLVYVGVDSNNFDDLGAEIEIDLGKEHERYVIDKPSVVALPAGVAHGPIVTRWADRPYAFFSINLAGQSIMKFID
jgi:hypothetical protein